MDPTERFVRDKNLDRLVVQLLDEQEPSRRETLRKLMIEEEDRYGVRLERLEKVEKMISDGEARVLVLARLFSASAAKDQAALNESVLANHHKILELFRDYRRTLVEAIDRNPI